MEVIVGSFIDSIIKLLLRLIIILFLIFICFIGYALFFSKTNELSLKDSFYYIMPFASESSNITLSDKNSIKFNINTNTISYSNSTSSSKSINFYYAQLDNTSKIIYDSLESNINNLKTYYLLFHYLDDGTVADEYTSMANFCPKYTDYATVGPLQFNKFSHMSYWTDECLAKYNIDKSLAEHAFAGYRTSSITKFAD